MQLCIYVFVRANDEVFASKVYLEKLGIFRQGYERSPRQIRRV